MTERDAFGNPIEETRPTSQPLTEGDPLRAPAAEPAVGAGPDMSLGIPAEPAETAQPSAPAPTLAPLRRRRRRLLGLGGLVGLVLFLMPLIGGWFVYEAIRDTVSDTTDTLRDLSDLPDRTTTITGSSGPDGSSAPSAATPPRGLDRHSLLRSAAVDALLRKARADPGGKLLLLRLAPERADLQLSRRGGGMSIVQLRYDGGRSLVRTPAGGSASTSITFSKIDRNAPSRLVRAAANRLGRKTSSIDYLVLLNILDGPRWSAYFKGGAAFQGDAHGKIVRRIQ